MPGVAVSKGTEALVEEIRGLASPVTGQSQTSLPLLLNGLARIVPASAGELNEFWINWGALHQ